METLNAKIDLSNGYVLARSFIDRKTMRAYRKALFVGSSTVEELQKDGTMKDKLKFDINSMDEANDVLVRGVVLEANINEKNIGLDDDFFDGIDQEDFDKILGHAVKLMDKKDKEKKS